LNSKIQFCYGFDTSPFVIGVANAKLKKLDSKVLKKAENIAKNFKYSNKDYNFPKWESFSKYATKQQFNIIMDFIEA
ncbi:site-specific DNA-methyltransferase, partial [Campylobacter jejuni]